MGFVRKLRSIGVVALAAGLGPAACVADPIVPCGAFEPGDAAENTVVRAQEGVIAAVAMRGESFVLRNVCDGPSDTCRVEKRALAELSPGSQVMLTTDGRTLVGIDHDGGDVWTYSFDAKGRLLDKEPTYTDQTYGPAQLVIGMRDSSMLVVRDHEDRLAVYETDGTQSSRAERIAPELGVYVRLAAVGERWVALREVHSESRQTLYLVDVETDPDTAYEIAEGDFTSVVFGPADDTLVLSEGRGTEASVLVFDVDTRVIFDAFAGDLISSRTENDHRAIEEVPGLHALSPGGEQMAYRTTSGSLAVRKLDTRSSCVVRNTNRLGTGRTSARRGGDHAVAGFSADGLLYAEYTVGAAKSFVYAYDPRHQQITALGREDAGWHLAAVPGRVTDPSGEIERLWAVGVHHGKFHSIGEGRTDGQLVGEELTFMPLDDEGVWAIDTRDEIVGPRRAERALSVRRVAPPRWADGALRFEQGSDEQVVTYSDEHDSQGPMRVPLTGRVCLTTGVPGSWAYRCGDSTGTRAAFTTDSGRQEQTSDPNERPQFDPPFPDQGDDPPQSGKNDPEDPSAPDPSRN